MRDSIAAPPKGSLIVVAAVAGSNPVSHPSFSAYLPARSGLVGRRFAALRSRRTAATAKGDVPQIEAMGVLFRAGVRRISNSIKPVRRIRRHSSLGVPTGARWRAASPARLRLQARHSRPSAEHVQVLGSVAGCPSRRRAITPQPSQVHVWALGWRASTVISRSELRSGC